MSEVKKTLPRPKSPEPVQKKCSTCSGDGRVRKGKGSVLCPECNGGK